jgi:hypothetical protein
MTDYHESKVVALAGVPNGGTKQFTTPSAFVAGSFRLVLNGQVYEPADDKFGWAEISDSIVELTTAPRAGDVLQGFYQELAAVPGVGNVKGSPFHPSDSYP